MYYRACDFPELSGLSAAERKELLTEAIKKYCPGKSARFVIACCMLLAISAIGGILISSKWSILVALLCGQLFYAYLLWEINGPTAKAVKRLIEERSNA